MQLFKGCSTAIVTPFTKDNKINYTVFEKLINFQIQNGVNAIVFMGTTGEASTLSENEKIDILKFATQFVNNRAQIIIGAGGNNTKEVINRSKTFEKYGATALLQVTPYYNKCTQKGLIEHYKKIANSVSIPQILYNVPSRTGVNILPETAKILSRVKNIIGIKEASGNLSNLTELSRILPKNFSIYSGEDENIFTTLALGGNGIISVVSNIFPKETVRLCNLTFKEHYKTARKLQFKLSPVIKQLFSEVNPIPVKSALKILGFNVGHTRLPLTKLSTENFVQLKKVIKEFVKK